MTEYTVSILRCPKCGYMTNKPIDRKNHEDLKCNVRMDRHSLIYEVYSRYITLKIANHLTLDVFIK